MKMHLKETGAQTYFSQAPGAPKAPGAPEGLGAPEALAILVTPLVKSNQILFTLGFT